MEAILISSPVSPMQLFQKLNYLLMFKPGRVQVPKWDYQSFSKS